MTPKNTNPAKMGTLNGKAVRNTLLIEYFFHFLIIYLYSFIAYKIHTTNNKIVWITIPFLYRTKAPLRFFSISIDNVTTSHLKFARPRVELRLLSTTTTYPQARFYNFRSNKEPPNINKMGSF